MSVRTISERETSTFPTVPGDDWTYKNGWRCGSVVRMSVFGWQTFPDLCPIYGWHVTTLWEKCPTGHGSTNQTNSAFHPYGVGKWVVIHVNTWIMRVVTIKRQVTSAHAVSRRSGPVGVGLAYRLYDCCVCNRNSVLEMVSGWYAIQIHLLTYLLKHNDHKH